MEVTCDQARHHIQLYRQWTGGGGRGGGGGGGGGASIVHTQCLPPNFMVWSSLAPRLPVTHSDHVNKAHNVPVLTLTAHIKIYGLNRMWILVIQNAFARNNNVNIVSTHPKKRCFVQCNVNALLLLQTDILECELEGNFAQNVETTSSIWLFISFSLSLLSFFLSSHFYCQQFA